MTFWDWLGTDKGQMLLAGVFGASVNAVMEWEGMWPTARKIFVGTTAAYFLGPMGAPFFAWAGGTISFPADQAVSAGGFLMGVSGVVVVEIIMRIWKSRKRELEDRE